MVFSSKENNSRICFFSNLQPSQLFESNLNILSSVFFRVEEDSVIKNWGHKQCWGAYFWRHHISRGQNGGTPVIKKKTILVEYFLNANISALVYWMQKHPIDGRSRQQESLGGGAMFLAVPVQANNMYFSETSNSYIILLKSTNWIFKSDSIMAKHPIVGTIEQFWQKNPNFALILFNQIFYQLEKSGGKKSCSKI